MRQITINEAKEISGGVVPQLIGMAGSGVVGCFAANALTPYYPQLGHVLATIGSAAGGAAAANYFGAGYEIIGALASGFLGFYSSTHPASDRANHFASVMGGGSTAATVAYFSKPLL